MPAAAMAETLGWSLGRGGGGAQTCGGGATAAAGPIGFIGLTIPHVARLITLVGYSTPIFWFGMMAFLVFYAWFSVELCALLLGVATWAWAMGRWGAWEAAAPRQIVLR